MQKQQNRECDSAHNHTIMLGIYSVRSMADKIRCHSERTIQENTYPSSNSPRRFYEHCQVCKCDYKCGEHIDTTWIHIRPRIRRRANFNKEKTFSATGGTVVVAYARPSTTERQHDLKSGLPPKQLFMRTC